MSDEKSDLGYGSSRGTDSHLQPASGRSGVPVLDVTAPVARLNVVPQTWVPRGEVARSRALVSRHLGVCKTIGGFELNTDMPLVTPILWHYTHGIDSLEALGHRLL